MMHESKRDVFERILTSAPLVVGGCVELERHLARLGDAVRDDGQLGSAVRDLRGHVDRLVLDLRSLSVSAETRPHQVLVVEDSEDTREVISAVLENAGFGVISASNGLEALIAAHDLHPHAIVMDLTMPILDGITATRLLKARAATRDVPVIAHTGQPAKCISLKPALFAEIAMKPVDSALLVKLLYGVINAH
jgi:CheY-like chemotaxis protein